MPKFIVKKVGRGISAGRRRFVARSQKQARPKVARSAVSSDKRVRQRVDTTIDCLNVLLDQDVATKKRDAQRDSEVNAIYAEDPEVFNGVSTADEARDLYDQALSYERKKSQSVESQVGEIALEHEREKKELEAQIRALKRELHRTAPLHDTKFFSLSKELQTAIVDLERVADQAGPVIQPLSSVAPRQTPLPSQVFVAPAAPPVVSKTVTKLDPVQPETVTDTKGLAKRKLLVTGVSAMVVIFVLSGMASLFLRPPQVDEKLVAEYLSQAGQVQGANSGGSESTAAAEPDPSQADVTFEQSVWDDYKDPPFGIVLQYPKNAVKVIRTDSNVTFIRKTGYLFKIQRIETSFSVDDYWKQIRSTSLNYVATSERFKGKVALKLELEDMTDYPGDRYLIRQGDFIYDVWFATPSPNFSADDIKLAEKMLASLSIVDVVEY